MHVWFQLPSSIENVGKQKENVCSRLSQNTMLLVRILYAYRGRKYRNKMQVYFCNIFQAFSFKMTLQKSSSHKESLFSANCTMSFKLSATKKIAKMKESLY